MSPGPRCQRLSAAVLRLACDQRLVQQVAAGSEPAFEAIFDRYHRPLLAFCRHMLGSREEAEDAVQHTFLAAYRELARDENTVALRPWLYAIARHHNLSLLRARGRQRVLPAPESASDPLAADVSAREDLRAILSDVVRLPEEQRAALVLAELGDLSHEEIATIVGCPREKVKALVFQARSSLAVARSARETPCAEIREQLATLHGSALRRATLHRHLHGCAGCRAFREQLRIQRRALGALLPVAPMVGLKRAVLGALFESGGGAAATGGALGTGALVVTAVVAIAVPGGGLAARAIASRDGRGADGRAATTPPPRVRTIERASGSSGAERRIAERGRTVQRGRRDPRSGGRAPTAERPLPHERPQQRDSGTDQASRAASPESSLVPLPAPATRMPDTSPPPTAARPTRGKAAPPSQRRAPRDAPAPSRRPAQPGKPPQANVPTPARGPDEKPPAAPTPPAAGPPADMGGMPTRAGAEDHDPRPAGTRTA